MIEIKESGRYETRFELPLCYGETPGYWTMKRYNPEDGVWGRVIARTWWYWK